DWSEKHSKIPSEFKAKTADDGRIIVSELTLRLFVLENEFSTLTQISLPTAYAWGKETNHSRFAFENWANICQQKRDMIDKILAEMREIQLERENARLRQEIESLKAK